MSATAAINLQTNDPDCLLNFLGMQPIFYTKERGSLPFIPSVDIFCVDRVQNKRHPYGKMRIHSRTTTDNVDIFSKAYYLQNADEAVVNTLLRNSDHFINNQSSLRESILFFANLIRYRTALNKANFIISSDEDALVDLKFKFTELLPTKLLVDESILPKDQIIIGLRELNTFANPICACPLIEINEFRDFIRQYRYSPSYFDTQKQYPFIEQALDRYELYQHFLNEVGFNRFYIHEFKTARIKAPYITLHL